MKHIINNIAKQTANRIAMLLMFVLGITSYASAGNVLSVGDLTNVVAGQEYDLQFNFANETAVRTMTVDFKLPEGLDIVSGAQPVKNTSISQSITMSTLDSSSKQYRVGIFSFSSKTFAAQIGKLFTIKVKANTSVRNSTVSIVNSDVTDVDNNQLAVTYTEGKVTIKSSFNGTMNFTATNPTFSILPGNTYKVEFQVENSAALTGMQAKLTLPVGLTMVPEEIVPDATRAGSAIPAYNATTGVVALIISSGISGTSGPLFSFTVKADNTLAADSKITLGDINFTIGDGDVNYTTSDVVEVAVKNAMADEYTAAKKVVTDLKDSVAAANAAIAKDYKDVAAQFTDKATEISGQIETLSGKIETAKADGTLRIATVNSDAATIITAIHKMIADAKAAQDKVNQDVAAKKAANDAAYKTLSAKIADAQAKLDAANATIAKDCKDVAAQFTKTATDLSTQITALKTDLDAKNAKTELTAESTVNTADIETAIAKMVTDAQAAQKKFEADAADAAKKAANDAAYKTLSAQIADIQAKLDAAIARIKTNYAGVADQFTKTETGIQTKIDALKTQLENDHNNIALTADSKVNTTDIDLDIYQLLADASAAQKEYAAKVAANDAAYTRLNAEIAATQKNLDAAKATINKDYAGIAKDYAAELTSLQSQITTMKNGVQNDFIAVKLTADSQIDTEAIDKAITELLAKAKAAYEVYAGIDSVTAEQLAGAKVFYTLGGKKLDAPAKGQVNVVKMSDGRMIKIFVK